MRAFLLLFTCVLVVGIVLFAMLQSPVRPKTDLVVSRIDAVQRPLPVLQSDLAADHVLDFFPDLKPQETVTPQQEREENPAKAQVQLPRQAPRDTKNGDLTRLLALIEDWVYVDFSQIGTSKKGTIQKTRENQYFPVFEGEELESGIKVVSLSNEVCTLVLGQGTFSLPLAVEPAFFKEIQTKMRPLTQEEQNQAYEYYMNRYGKKFEAYSTMYKPLYGTQMPKRLTAGDKQKRLKEYFDRYGKNFQQERGKVQSPFPYTEQQKQNYIKYWQTFFPDRPMPDFEKMFNQGNQIGPGSREVPSPSSQ